MEMIPILESEAPKVAAIKSDTSLTKVQKLQQLKALHDQNDPKVRSILTSDQYQQLQKIRQQEIADAVKKKLPQ
jgi:protein CpxP